MQIGNTYKRDRKLIILGLLCLFASSFSFYIYQEIRDLRCCDADSYLALANNINLYGVESAIDSLRTWGYPWFLSILLKVASVINLSNSLLVWMIQTGIYAFGALLIYRSVAKKHRDLAIYSFFLLCINIFIHPYMGISLTDGLATSLTILFYAQILKFRDILRCHNRGIVFYFFWITLTASAAVVVRPAAIWVALPLFVLIIHACCRKRLSLDVLAAIFIGMFPLMIQIALNAVVHDTVSVFPVANLGDSQIRWGIENIKYATWLGGGPGKNYYPSSNLVGSVDANAGLLWYFDNPIDAAKLLAFKFVGAFDWDYLVPYPKSAPFFKWSYSFFSLSLLFFGLLGSIANIVTSSKLRFLGPRYMALLLIFSWSAVTMLSAVELRFSLPMICLFLIMLPSVFVWISKQSRTRQLMLSLCYCSFMILSFSMSAYVRSQSVVQ